MTKALIYKEWLKTKWIILGIIVTNIALLTYMFISVSHSFRVVGIPHIWNAIVNKHAFLFSELQYLTIACATILSLAQYIPEISKKRLKLTLHLPINQTKSVFTMVAFGVAILLICCALQMFVVLLFVNKYFPIEIGASTIYTILPWHISGIVAYLLVACICLEPTWKNRVIYFIISLPIIGIFFLSSFPLAYVNITWLLIGLTIILFVVPIQSVKRFKQGMQD